MIRRERERDDLQVLPLGTIDWYIDAIISYQIIHYGLLKPEVNYSHEEMAILLSKYTFSSDSKKPVSDSYFIKMNNEKLRNIFPYLYSYVNNEYFTSVYPKHQRDLKYVGCTDITQFETLPKQIDIFTYSFPCQDLSQQGKQRGLEGGTRSGLLYEVERILKNNKDRLPKVLLLENVKTLASSKFKSAFDEWINTLDQLGYETAYKVVNSVDYGSAQNRERVYAVSILKSNLKKSFIFPTPIKGNGKQLEDIIHLEHSDKLLNDLLNKYDHSSFITTSNNITKSRLLNYTNFNSEAYIYLPKGKGPTLTASGANSRLKFYFREKNTLKAISPSESYLYMGFDTEDYSEVAKSNLVSNSKMIYTCGNSISVEVLEQIFAEILKCLK
ncbi:DNA (cytosine-5-)-methyltransferase N-terminal subunit [Mycoplasma sp. SK928A]|uniref:DNA (cytosine-5-)-methyltransferase N-terminal subunit n=1 Tax=Mycoplasma sp. SK928A TaxID=3401671 RepID=UPI003AAEAA75